MDKYTCIRCEKDDVFEPESREPLYLKMAWMQIEDKIPFITFPKEWRIRIRPPMGGAVARFLVKNDYGEDISVYLDFFDNLGYMKRPYWEAYPIHSDDGDGTRRFLLDDAEGLIDCIQSQLDYDRRKECGDE